MNNQETKNWIVKANHDLRIVQHELKLSDEEVTTDVLCFHCQQFVEKVLKSYLVENNIDFKKTHDLEYLLKLCSNKDSEFLSFIEITKKITDYAVEVRYPDDFYMPTIEEAKECYRIALNVKDFIFKKMGIKDDDLK